MLQIQVMGRREKVLGDEYSDTIGAVASLALTYSHRRRLINAEEVRLWVVETRKMVLNDGNLITLGSMVNLSAYTRNKVSGVMPASWI